MRAEGDVSSSLGTHVTSAHRYRDPRNSDFQDVHQEKKEGGVVIVASGCIMEPTPGAENVCFHGC